MSDSAIAIYEMLDGMNSDDLEAIADLFTREMKAKKKWRPKVSSADKDAWLADDNLRGTNLFLAAACAVRDPKQAALRTSMISEKLDSVGRRLSNLTNYLRDLVEMSPPLAEIVNEGQGRAGITFALTPAGVAAGADLHRVHEKGGTDT